MIPIYVEIYICVLLVFIGLWILIDAMLDTWEAEHQVLISQLEEQEKHALQTKVKVLEERYQEMLKSRKVVHDMKNIFWRSRTMIKSRTGPDCMNI